MSRRTKRWRRVIKDRIKRKILKCIIRMDDEVKSKVQDSLTPQERRFIDGI
jgi:hypothetical protein